QAARTRTQRREPRAELGGGVVKAGIRGLEVVVRRQAFLLRPHRLVAGRATLAAEVAGQLPDDPVGRLDERVRGVVDLAVLEPKLDQLGEVPLGGGTPAVA